MNRARQSLWIAALAGILVAAWLAFLSLGFQRPVVAESNYQANLLRLQEFAHGPDSRPVLAGSSITGRLLSPYFDGTPLAGAVNLGLDGSGPTLGLELISTRTNLPAAILIEANILGLPPGNNDDALRDAFLGMTLRLAERLPFLRAENRPSTRLYDALKRRADERPKQARQAGADNSPRVDPVAQHFLLNRHTPEQRAAHKDRVRKMLQGLLERGARIMIVRYPREGVDDAAREFDFDDELARDLRIPHLDLGRRMKAGGVAPEFTDGIHFTAASARAAARLIAEGFAASTRVPPGP